MKLRDKINSDLTIAMKAREAERLSVLRMMKTSVKNREIEVRSELEDAQVVQVLSTMIKQRREAAEQFHRGGRPELAEKELAEISILEQYLPASVTDEEIESVVAEVIAATGATSPQDLGRVMKQCMARFSGKLADGKKISGVAARRLQAREGRDR